MIRLSKSIVGKAESEAVARVLLEDGYLGMGTEVQKFEEEIASYLGISPENVVCVSSGTAALHLAVQAVINPGDEILVPSFTFLSSYQAISAAGAVPISCDIREDSLLIDISDAFRRITSKTKAIMPVLYASNPSYLDKIYEFAAKNNIRVIEDAAHAFGCEFKSRKIGSFGDVICFSFDGIKNITSGEGGAVISFDKKVTDLVKDSRLLGVIKDSEKRYAGKRSWDFDVIHQGYRYHMSNIFAAIGRVQLSRLNSEFAVKRVALAQLYRSQLDSLSGIVLPSQESESLIIPHIFPIRVLNEKRDGLRAFLLQNEVQTGIHYKPNHLLTKFGAGKISLPITERIYQQILTLPLHPELSTSEIDFICNLIRQFLKNS